MRVWSSDGPGEARGIIAPGPVLGSSAEACFDWVSGDVQSRCAQLRIGLDAGRAVAALEQVASALVTEVEFLGVAPVERLNAPGEARLGGFDQQMDVVCHEAVG